MNKLITFLIIVAIIIAGFFLFRYEKSQAYSAGANDVIMYQTRTGNVTYYDQQGIFQTTPIAQLCGGLSK